MYDNVNALHDIIENVGGGKIPGDSHGKQLPVFCSTGFHLIGLGLRPRCTGNLDPTLEEKVNNVGTYKARGACNENMTGRRVVSFIRTCCT